MDTPIKTSCTPTRIHHTFLWFFLLLAVWSTAVHSQQITASMEPGFYSGPEILIFTSSEPDAQIFYSLDGSAPSEESTPYQGPIELSERTGVPNTISEIPTNPLDPGHPYRENWLPPAGEVFKIYAIRAVGIMPDGTKGEEWKGSFIIDPLAANRYTMPVFSIITEPDNFFGYEEGIYVPGILNGNYFQRGREWEREVHLEFFEEGGQRVLAQDAGARIHGGTSRNRPRKSLRLYARSDYGNSWFDYRFFSDKDVDRHKRFLLRNSGNDWSESVFRDAFIQSLVKENTDLDIQYSRPSIVFINGEYWGIHNIRDRFDGRYLQSHYDMDPDRIVIMTGNRSHDHGSTEGIADYSQLFNYALQQDLAQEDHYKVVSERMDIDNFIDYQIIQIYCRNTDWPGNNIAYWKYMDGDLSQPKESRKDGRWRWMVYDLDFGFGLDFDYVYNFGAPHGGNDASHNTLSFALEPDGPNWPNPPWSTALFRNLMESPVFKAHFANRFADHLNTTFSPLRVVDQLNKFEKLYEAEIEEHIHRWREPSYEHWVDNIETMRVFGLLRAPLVFSHLDNTLNLEGTEVVELNVNNPQGGTIQVNSVVLSTQHKGVYDPVFPWEGKYFKGVPIQLVALPEVGYEFSHWEGDHYSQEDTLRFSPGEIGSVTAHFVRGSDFVGDSMNPPAHHLLQSDYLFEYWDPYEPEGHFPPNMVFQQSDTDDPALFTEMTHPYHIPYTDADNNEYHANDQDKIGFPYSLTGRTRIEGLGSGGIAFINTGRGRDLGAAVLAINTEGIDGALIDWEAQTLEANSRVYQLRLQYRVGQQGEWKEVNDENGQPAEYERQEHSSTELFSGLQLPGDAIGKPYVQLRWKYYFTGLRLTDEYGSRDKIRLDNIYIRKIPVSTENYPNAAGFRLFQNYPNPHSGSTRIEFELPDSREVVIELLDFTGRPIDELIRAFYESGRYSLDLDLSSLPAGVYFYRMKSGTVEKVKKMVLVK